MLVSGSSTSAAEFVIVVSDSVFVGDVVKFVSEVVEFASDVELDSFVAFEVLFYDSVLLLLLYTKLSGSTVISISMLIVFFGYGSADLR